MCLMYLEKATATIIERASYSSGRGLHISHGDRSRKEKALTLSREMTFSRFRYIDRKTVSSTCLAGIMPGGSDSWSVRWVGGFARLAPGSDKESL